MPIVIGVMVAGTTAYCSGVKLFSGIVDGGWVPIGTTVILGIGSDTIVPGVAGLIFETLVGIICTGITEVGSEIETGPKQILPDE